MQRIYSKNRDDKETFDNNKKATAEIFGIPNEKRKKVWRI